MLDWRVSTLEDEHPFPKPINERAIYAHLFSLNLDYSDLTKLDNCRIYDGGISFGIHPRVSNPKEFILMVNGGRHIHCKTLEEAKEIAEKICKRIIEAYKELLT